MPVVQLRNLPEIASSARFKADIQRITCDPPSTVTDTLANGTIYICEDRLLYFSDASSHGFSLDYQSIVIHAVSRGEDNESDNGDVDAYLYCQLDGPFLGTSTGQSDDSDEDEEDEEQFAELRFYPKNEQNLDDMFKAMSECAALNPDPNDSDDRSEEEGDGKEDLFHIGAGQKNASESKGNGTATNSDSAISQISSFDPSGFITSPDQLDQLTPEGRAVLAHLESVIVTDMDGRFDDAPENSD